MSSGKAVQGERTAIFAHLLRFFWLVSRCFAGMVRRGQKLSPRRNETPEKNFFKTARILGSQAPQGSGKLSQYLAACRKIFARLLRAALVAFASVLLAFFFYFFRLLLLRFVRFALAWSLGLVPWPLLHGLLDVVLEALLQIAADQFFDRFLGLAAYHLRHG